MEARDTLTLLGVPVDRVTMTQALKRIEGFIASKRPHLVATADASMLVDAHDIAEFGDLLRTAELVTPDSAGILWAARRAGRPIEARVSGVDIVDEICRLSAQKGYRIYFLGAEPGVAEMAAERLRLRHPGCNIVGARHGYFPAGDDEVVAKEVSEAKPNVLFVAMGIPRQEQFIQKTQGIIQAEVSMGVGGSLDVYSGRVKRAPALFQKLKLEWLWRLIQNPSKWRKAIKLPRFVMLVLRSKA